MSKLNYKIFEGGAELISYTADGSRYLTLGLGDEYQGYISLGRLSVAISSRDCIVDTSSLSDGEYQLSLVLEDRTLLLGNIVKINGVIVPDEKGESKIRRLSIDERLLEEMVNAIDSRLKKIEEKVYGSHIF